MYVCVKSPCFLFFIKDECCYATNNTFGKDNKIFHLISSSNHSLLASYLSLHHLLYLIHVQYHFYNVWCHNCSYIWLVLWNTKKISYDINMIYISRNTHNQTYLIKNIPFMDFWIYFYIEWRICSSKYNLIKTWTWPLLFSIYLIDASE